MTLILQGAAELVPDLQQTAARANACPCLTPALPDPTSRKREVSCRILEAPLGEMEAYPEVSRT